jgi:glutaryl-CoA dehydrogenase
MEVFRRPADHEEVTSGSTIGSPIMSCEDPGLEAGLGEALRTDYFLLREEFTSAQLGYLERTRAFVHDEVLPVINGYWERAEFPWPLIAKLGATGLVGDITGVSAFTGSYGSTK